MTDLRRGSRVSEDTHVVVKDNIDQQIMTVDHIEHKHSLITHPQHWHSIVIKRYYNCCYPYCHQAATKLKIKEILTCYIITNWLGTCKKARLIILIHV